jgi:dolichyl-phosphate-mannose--protein O-mannosyl transferase
VGLRALPAILGSLTVPAVYFIMKETGYSLPIYIRFRKLRYAYVQLEISSLPTLTQILLQGVLSAEVGLASPNWNVHGVYLGLQS